MSIKSIRDAMRAGSFLSARPAITLAEASDMMDAQPNCPVVVQENGVLRGILTEADVIRHVSQRGGFRSTPVAQVMTRNVTCVQTRDSLLTAVSVMHDGGFDSVPVLDLGQKVIGVLAIDDIPVEYRTLQERGLRSGGHIAAA